MRHVTEKLENAIKTMREACDEAALVATDETISDGERAVEVMRILAWGHANSNKGVESALRFALKQPSSAKS